MDRWAGKIAAIACLSMGQVDDVAAATVPRHFSHISCASPHPLHSASPNAIATCQVCISVCIGVGVGQGAEGGGGGGGGGREGGGATINNGPLGELFSSWGQTMEHGHYRLLWQQQQDIPIPHSPLALAQFDIWLSIDFA